MGIESVGANTQAYAPKKSSRAATGAKIGAATGVASELAGIYVTKGIIKDFYESSAKTICKNKAVAKYAAI